ncbi:cornifin-B-like [Portunus trituberculatus]|uniref:cornifin-B-like n=1 Tax=Portunus trituberculatus TaxID=210409 RepID=UPI001E1D19F5|nr:cornifin-B-like [Portunus trituberculatus]
MTVSEQESPSPLLASSQLSSPSSPLPCPSPCPCSCHTVTATLPPRPQHPCLTDNAEDFSQCLAHFHDPQEIGPAAPDTFHTTRHPGAAQQDSMCHLPVNAVLPLPSPAPLSSFPSQYLPGCHRASPPPCPTMLPSSRETGVPVTPLRSIHMVFAEYKLV